MPNAGSRFIVGVAGILLVAAEVLAQTQSNPRNLSGVWISKRDGNQVVDEKYRPPMTPWAQARFDAAVPTLGPRVIAGKENDPILRCNPDGIPKLLGVPQPSYRHHRLIRDEAGQKLSKSTQATGLRELRAAGATPAGIRQLVGLP